MRACLLSSAVTRTAAGEPAANTATTGFAIPFAGAPAYEHVATQMTDPDQRNQPLGRALADTIAGQVGLSSADALTEQQYCDLSTGGGIGGSREAADVIDSWSRSSPIRSAVPCIPNGITTNHLAVHCYWSQILIEPAPGCL